jgi:hypothetical protein
MGVKISHHTKGRTRFRVSENRMLRRISGPKGKKWQEGEEDCIMRGFIICIFTSHLGEQIKEDKMSVACNTYGRDEKCIKNDGQNT